MAAPLPRAPRPAEATHGRGPAGSSPGLRPSGGGGASARPPAGMMSAAAGCGTRRAFKSAPRPLAAGWGCERVCLRECADAEGGTDGRTGRAQEKLSPPVPTRRRAGIQAHRPALPGGARAAVPHGRGRSPQRCPRRPPTGRAEPGACNASGRALGPLPGRPPPSV